VCSHLGGPLPGRTLSLSNMLTNKQLKEISEDLAINVKGLPADATAQQVANTVGARLKQLFNKKKIEVFRIREISEFGTLQLPEKYGTLEKAEAAVALLPAKEDVSYSIVKTTHEVV
jgi:hypothetical protein